MKGVAGFPGLPGRDGLKGPRGIDGLPGVPGQDGYPGGKGKCVLTNHGCNPVLMRKFHVFFATGIQVGKDPKVTVDFPLGLQSLVNVETLVFLDYLD